MGSKTITNNIQQLNLLVGFFNSEVVQNDEMRSKRINSISYQVSLLLVIRALYPFFPDKEKIDSLIVSLSEHESPLVRGSLAGEIKNLFRILHVENRFFININQIGDLEQVGNGQDFKQLQTTDREEIKGKCF